MTSNLSELIRIASKVKTPLMLSGIVIIVLYAIYRQVLSLDVFENLGRNYTFILLQYVLNRIFWLAIIAMILGVISYIITFILELNNRTSSNLSDVSLIDSSFDPISNVSLIDASFDPTDSIYEEKIEKGRKKIKIKSNLVTKNEEDTDK